MKRSRLEAFEMSIDGDEVASVFAAERGSYLPDRKNSSSTLFSLVANTSVSMGRPICRANCPEKMLPKLPEGTAYDTLKSARWRSEEHTSELQSRGHLVCRLLLEKKKTI